MCSERHEASIILCPLLLKILDPPLSSVMVGGEKQETKLDSYSAGLISNIESDCHSWTPEMHRDECASHPSEIKIVYIPPLGLITWDSNDIDLL